MPSSPSRMGTFMLYGFQTGIVQANLSGPPSESFQNFQWSPSLLGSQIRLIPPSVLLKSSDPPQNPPTPPPPPPQVINNDRSLMRWILMNADLSFHSKWRKKEKYTESEWISPWTGSLFPQTEKEIFCCCCSYLNNDDIISKIAKNSQEYPTGCFGFCPFKTYCTRSRSIFVDRSI